MYERMFVISSENKSQKHVFHMVLLSKQLPVRVYHSAGTCTHNST